FPPRATTESRHKLETELPLLARGTMPVLVVAADAPSFKRHTKPRRTKVSQTHGSTTRKRPRQPRDSAAGQPSRSRGGRCSPPLGTGELREPTLWQFRKTWQARVLERYDGVNLRPFDANFWIVKGNA